MALPAFDPYYGGSDTLLKKMKQQATLSGMPPLTEEQLAAYTYGQRKSESETALAREQMAKNFEIANMQNALSAQRIRALNKESGNRGAGQTVAGAVSLLNLANQAYPGALKGIGQALTTGAKAVPGLMGIGGGGQAPIASYYDPSAYYANIPYGDYGTYAPIDYAGLMGGAYMPMDYGFFDYGGMDFGQTGLDSSMYNWMSF